MAEGSRGVTFSETLRVSFVRTLKLGWTCGRRLPMRQRKPCRHGFLLKKSL
jgi:hypothetical protein